VGVGVGIAGVYLIEFEVCRILMCGDLKRGVNCFDCVRVSVAVKTRSSKGRGGFFGCSSFAAVCGFLDGGRTPVHTRHCGV